MFVPSFVRSFSCLFVGSYIRSFVRLNLFLSELYIECVPNFYFSDTIISLRETDTFKKTAVWTDVIARFHSK